AKAFEALDQRQKSVSVLKELARILGENGDSRGRDATWRKILQLAPGDPDAEAALTNPGRARPPSQPAIEDEIVSPRPVAAVIASNSPSNATGGRAVMMSASGHMRTVDEDDEAGRSSWNAPQSALQDPPTRGVADPDESAGHATALGAEEEIAKILNETDV